MIFSYLCCPYLLSFFSNHTLKQLVLPSVCGRAPLDHGLKLKLPKLHAYVATSRVRVQNRSLRVVLLSIIVSNLDKDGEPVWMCPHTLEFNITRKKKPVVLVLNSRPCRSSCQN